MKKVDEIADFARLMKQAINTTFTGSPEAVHFAVLGLASSLHVLIEDVPGVGKTTLAKATAQAAGLSFSRIQFTPDMLPGDVLGMNVWNPSKNEFVFRPGSINAQCILADELNRTSPRTQSAFLEAMQEGQTTVDGVTRYLPQPFFMIATQNPQNFTGTFPLPEAELDRFGISLSIGYPSKEDELTILSTDHSKKIEPIANPEIISEIRKSINEIKINPIVQKFIVDIIRGTRTNSHIRLGASPRASVFLQQAAKTQAAFENRDFVMPEDVLKVCTAVLQHRILLSSSAQLDHLDSKLVIQEVCSRIPLPSGL